MKIKLKKYLISFLALLLVLSNFSFAASYMLCNMEKKMDKAGFTTCCSDNDKNDNEVQGLTIDGKDNSCCKIAVRELINTNILLTFNNQLKQILFELTDITTSSQTSLSNNFQSSKYIYFGDRIPPPDIRIITSSFLI